MGYNAGVCWSFNANDALEARSARKAAVVAFRAATDDPETIASAELIVGELISNAARHTDGHVCLELAVEDGVAQLSLHDASPTFALDIRRPTDEMSESGRGLFIISNLADRIDVVPLTNIGKCVTVRLNVPISGPSPFARCARHWLRGGGKVCMGPLIARYQPQITPP
jgi:anti-sigma regulatory factor (Ser/Thr protein kinase)